MPLIASSAASAASAATHLASGSPDPAWWAQGIWTSELAKGLPAAFVALAIGLVAAVIAWRQARIAEAKLKLDLFEKRLKVFDAVWALLAASHVKPGEPDQTVAAFYAQLPNAGFLFDDSVRTYVERIRGKLQELQHAAESLRVHHESRPAYPMSDEMVVFNREHASLMDAMHQLQAWFLEQAEPCRAMFATHLSFGKWR
jgi:hypothetical protein